MEIKSQLKFPTKERTHAQTAITIVQGRAAFERERFSRYGLALVVRIEEMQTTTHGKMVRRGGNDSIRCTARAGNNRSKEDTSFHY